MSILLVDDSPDSARFLKLLLEEAGFREIQIALSATEAWSLLGLSSPQPANCAVQVVLMDVVMPGIDGIQACRRIKADARYQDLPVIMVTGQNDEEHLQRAFGAGATDYVSKPVRPAELTARLRSALTLKQAMDARKSREVELLEVTRRLEAANRELQRLSSLDGLTGIPNRRHFDMLFERSWGQAQRRRAPLSLVMIDIDFFKSFNDTYGHQLGDDCLRRVAAALRAGIHRPGDLVARYGGEEFITLLPDTDAVGAAVVAESLRERVRALAIPHERSPLAPHVTLSAGVAGIIPGPDNSAAGLVAAADQALYQVKQSGRNAVRVAGSAWETNQPASNPRSHAWAAS